MIDPRIAPALRILARLWLEELRAEDLPRLARLPELAGAVGGEPDELHELAAEHQRLFGFNLPPFESVFLDPSAMLGAPSTERLKGFYAAQSWRPPDTVRAAADDHLGLELMALADLVAAGRPAAAEALLRRHLLLWAPACISALSRLRPHPFYAGLGALTLGSLMNLLPEPEAAEAPLWDEDPFPDLPPPPRYRASEVADERHGPNGHAGRDPHAPFRRPPAADDPADDDLDLAGLTERLLVPRLAGMYLTRHDLAQLARDLGFQGPAGERRRLLQDFLRGAGAVGLAAEAVAGLDGCFAQAQAEYRAWAEVWPAWSPVAEAWLARLRSSRQSLAEGLRGESAMQPEAATVSAR